MPTTWLILTEDGAGGAGAPSNMLSVCLGRDAGCSRGNNISRHRAEQLQIAAMPENQPRCVLTFPLDSTRASSNMGTSRARTLGNAAAPPIDTRGAVLVPAICSVLPRSARPSWDPPAPHLAQSARSACQLGSPETFRSSTAPQAQDSALRQTQPGAGADRACSSSALVAP